MHKPGGNTFEKIIKRKLRASLKCGRRANQITIVDNAYHLISELITGYRQVEADFNSTLITHCEQFFSITA